MGVTLGGVLEKVIVKTTSWLIIGLLLYLAFYIYQNLKRKNRSKKSD